MTRISAPMRHAIRVCLVVLLPLGVVILSSFSLPCDLTIDGNGNLGDETMTMALTATTSVTSLPGYGYRPNGTPWRYDVNFAPVYGWLYTAAVEAAPPTRRIEAARLVSRAVGGVGLYFVALALLALVFQQSPLSARLWPQLAIVAGVALLFMNSPRFRFVTSFGRVDAIGFLCLTAVFAAAAQLIRRRDAISVFALVILTLITTWASYISFYLAAAVAGMALLLEAADRLFKSPASTRVSVVARVVVPVVLGVGVFKLVASLIHNGLLAGPATGATQGIIANFRTLATWNVHSEAMDLPFRGWLLESAAAGLVVVCIGESVRRWRRGGSPGTLLTFVVVGWGAWALLVIVDRLLMVGLGTFPLRFPYHLIIQAGLAFLQWIVFGMVFRDRPMARTVMAIATTVGLATIFVGWRPVSEPLFACNEDAGLKSPRRWPRRFGLYNPFDGAGSPDIEMRHRHVAAVRDYLVAHDVHDALTAEPMFTVMSDRSLSFVFVNDEYSTTPSPAAEELLLGGLVSRRGIRYVVSTEFGESEQLGAMDGYVGLRRCLRQAAAAGDGHAHCAFGPYGVDLARVFRSDATVGQTLRYLYADIPSTPIAVYAMTVGNSRLEIGSNPVGH